MRFREYLSKLSELKELKRVEDEVHWNLQAGALCAMTNRVGGPAIHFTGIKGYNKEMSLAGSLFTGPGTLYPHERTPWTRISLGLGMDKDISYEDLMAQLIDRKQHPIMPTKVSSGPCKERRYLGDDVDLFAFPFPYIHEGDGGRYGTSQIIIVKDPESNWINWGVYRFMILTKDQLVVNMHPRQDLGRIYQKYEAARQPMPFCIAIGVEPAAFFAAAASLPQGISEAEIAGGFQLEPMELVKAETNDLLVPAQAEIVIEGEVLQQEANEGPFVDYVGRTEPKPQPIFQVKAITHRKSTIIPFVAEGMKVSDSMAILSIMASMNIMYRCQTERQYMVRWINLPVEARLGLCVVATLNPYKGYIYNLANFIFSQKLEAGFDKVLFVDADIDPVDLPRVVNDMIQKTDPEDDFHVGKLKAPFTPLAAYATREEMANSYTANMYIDATWPVEWEPDNIPIRLTFETCFPQEIQEKVLQRWYTDYGFKIKPQTKKVDPKWMKTAKVSLQY